MPKETAVEILKRRQAGIDYKMGTAGEQRWADTLCRALHLGTTLITGAYGKEKIPSFSRRVRTRVFDVLGTPPGSYPSPLLKSGLSFTDLEEYRVAHAYLLDEATFNPIDVHIISLGLQSLSLRTRTLIYTPDDLPSFLMLYSDYGEIWKEKEDSRGIYHQPVRRANLRDAMDYNIILQAASEYFNLNPIARLRS